MIVLIPDMNCNLSTIPLESKILYNVSLAVNESFHISLS